MTTTNKTLAKADAALEIIIKYDNMDGDFSFRQVLDEILLRWKDSD
jgi:hypothetical protein